MLSALRKEDHQQVILLREDGLARAEELRAQAREDRIVCEVCAQPVLVRAGTERTWHFAHRTREHCPKAQESMAMVACRARLYGWLRMRFPGAVRLEKVVPGLPRPVDCWVDRPGKPPLAWWLVTAGLKPEVRDQLAQVFGKLGVLTQYVFLADLLVRDPDRHQGFILGTTEREFMRPSRYGELGGSGFGSLHYLDWVTGHLVTCRDLLPIHPPQGYQGDLQDHALEEVRILPSTGEFVHPGEAERLEAALEAARLKVAQREEALRVARQARREQATLEAARLKEAQREETLRAARQARWEHAARLAAQAVRVPKVEAPAPAMPQAPIPPRAPIPAGQPEVPVYTCRVCGGRTRDWVVLYGNTGECKCRACARGMA